MRLGKTQTALLLIVDEGTRKVSGYETGRAFVWEDSIRYTAANGERAEFYMMRQDLRALARLCELGLVRKNTSKNSYSEFYTITEDGRVEVERLRDTHDPSRRPLK